MNYLEVKLTKEEQACDPANFISDVIKAQETLGLNDNSNSFDGKRLEELGFVFNNTTKGYALIKEFNAQQLEYLTREVSKLDNHILIHGYIELRIHNDRLYLWDKALIYEGIDKFEYCIKQHNTFDLGSLVVITKSETVHEDLLKIVNLTSRYNQPNLTFITDNCYWDKKEGYKINKDFVKDPLEYIEANMAKNFN